MSNAFRRTSTAFLWVGVIAPLAIITASALVVTAWLPQIPEPSATHWSGAGPDGFGPRWTHLAVLVGVGGGMVLLFAALAWFGSASARRRGAAWSDSWPPATRFLGGVNLGLAGMMSVVGLASVGVQRGIADAGAAPDIGPWVLVGFGVLVALTVVGWFLQPKGPHATAPPDAAPLPLADSERAVWVGNATVSLGGRVVLGIVVLSVLAMTVLTLAQGERAWWVAGVVAVIVAGLVSCSLTFRVRITDDGIVVRSITGWPNVEIPAADITAVRVIDVNPFGEFGGWGLRQGLDGRYGVVLRGGEALEVSRIDGRRFVVTIDDAATAASVLAAAAARR